MSQPPRIHPTAVVSPEAELADGVEIGPLAVVEGEVKLGPDCVLRPHAHVIGPLAMGIGNVVHSGAVIGDRPQHLKFNDEPTRVEIGDFNTFREHVTIHRATTHSWVTRIGDHNFFMAGSHVAHDCTVGSHCIFANGALLAGHCVVADNVFLSGNCAIHQFVRVGRLALLSGCAISSKDIPPFALQQGNTYIGGLNVVGMRRNGISSAHIDAVRRAYHILFREGNLLPVGLQRVENQLGDIPAVAELTAFIRGTKRGIAGTRERAFHREAA